MIIEYDGTKALEVLTKDKKVLIDVYGDGCPSCSMLERVLNTFADKNPETTIIKVNANKYRDIFAIFNTEIKSVPTLLVIKDNEVKANRKGFAPITVLKKFYTEA